MARSNKTTQKPILIDLALQGGGSHGAFTWGVLDRILDEPRFTIDAISGTSAGATFWANTARNVGVNLPAGGNAWAAVSDLRSALQTGS